MKVLQVVRNKTSKLVASFKTCLLITALQICRFVVKKYSDTLTAYLDLKLNGLKERRNSYDRK